MANNVFISQIARKGNKAKRILSQNFHFQGNKTDFSVSNIKRILELM